MRNYLLYSHHILEFSLTGFVLGHFNMIIRMYLSQVKDLGPVLFVEKWVNLIEINLSWLKLVIFLLKWIEVD